MNFMTDVIDNAVWHTNPSAGQWTCPAPSRDAVEFHRELPGYEPTPLVELPELAQKLSVARAFVKDESQRFDLGAFKFLGASWAVTKTLAQSPSTTTLVTATDGNHGRAVARMARLNGLKAVIYMPGTVVQKVVDRVIAEDADVTVLDDDYDAAIAAARDYTEAHPAAVLVQDTAWEGYTDIPGWIVEGYATLFTEIDEQLVQTTSSQPPLIAVPVGVGSLAQAAVAHYRSSAARSKARLLSVEPDTAACVLASLHRGQMQSVPTADTFMNGLNCGTPSDLAWPYLREGLDAAIAVPDEATQAAIDMLNSLDVGSGPSGAATVAGLLSALTGPGSDVRRAELGLGPESTVIALSTEGPIE